jgi:hypothetical protein
MGGSVKTAIVWGILYLTLKVISKGYPQLMLLLTMYKLFFESEKKWEKMVEISGEIRRKLVLLLNTAKALDPDGVSYEIRNALVEVLEALVDFWVEAVKWSNRYPIGRFAKSKCIRD